MTEAEQEALFVTLYNNLDTKDKAEMFIRCTFKDMLSDMEWHTNDLTMNTLMLFNRFKEKKMLGSLMAAVNSVFETDLTLTINRKAEA